VTWNLTNDKQLFLQLPEKPTKQTHHVRKSPNPAFTTSPYKLHHQTHGQP